MSIQHRVDKLEKNVTGNGRFYVFKVDGPIDHGAVIDAYFEDCSTGRPPNDYYVFRGRLAGVDVDAPPSWKFMYSNPKRG